MQASKLPKINSRQLAYLFCSCGRSVTLLARQELPLVRLQPHGGKVLSPKDKMRKRMTEKDREKDKGLAKMSEQSQIFNSKHIFVHVKGLLGYKAQSPWQRKC